MEDLPNKKFKISLFSETWTEINDCSACTNISITRKDKDVIVFAPSCCEAIVKAVKQNHGFTYLKHEEI